MILAGIDIGTNSLRLLIAETDCGAFREIHSDRRITRLGQGLDQTGMLSREAEDRTLRALLDFSAAILKHGALRTAAIGTSALRTASNTREFVHAVKQRTGLDITVITGEEEARLTLLGVSRALQRGRDHESQFPSSALVVDIGGGSTELIITRQDTAPEIRSLPLGAVYLTERFIKRDPPSPEELAKLQMAVRSELSEHAASLQPGPASVFVGAGGTITTLASVDQGLEKYDAERINRSVLTRAFIDRIVLKLGSMTLEARRGIRGLERGREDIIVAGAVVTQELMRHFRYPSIVVSDWGLREGIVLDLYEKLGQHDAGGG
jgi:exopolyphosphatase/guanosine-5'-triphosphate,3'-diphosphate pyrophosphatase